MTRDRAHRSRVVQRHGCAVKVTTTWHNAGPHTIWGRLAARLGREPTNEEAAAEMLRIMDESRTQRSGVRVRAPGPRGAG